MSRFFRQSYPHLVLLGSLGREQGEYGHNHKEHDYAKLYERIESEAAEQERIVITNVYIIFRRETDAFSPGRYVCGFCVIELYRPEIAVMIKLQLNGIVERD